MEDIKTHQVTLELYFIKKHILFTHLLLFGNIYEIKSDHIIINIEEKNFKYGNDIFPTQIKLFNTNDKTYNISHIFNLYFGKNIGYCFIGNEKGITYELIFKDEESLHISNENENLNFSKYDEMDTENRKRLLLINCPLNDININGIPFKFKDYKFDFFKGNSFQYSIYNINKKLICSSEIKLIKIEEDIPSYISKHNYKLNEFYSELKEFSKKEDSDSKNIENIIEKYKEIESFEIEFIKYQKHILEKNLDNQDFINLFFIKSLYDVIVNKKNKILKNKKYLRKVIFFLEKYKKRVIKDKYLSIFQKILVLRIYCYLFMRSSGIENFKNQNFQYLIISKAEENSVFKLCFNFINSFIDKLKVKSKLFFPLLQINSGIGYYTKKDKVYSFNMMNLNMIKEHLREIIPDILIFHKTKRTNNKVITYPNDGTIVFNTEYVFKMYNVEYFQKKPENEVEEITIKNNAMILFRYLFHEMMGHKKFMYKDYKDSDSPKKSITSDNQIITLVDESYKNNDNPNYWKILTDTDIECLNRGDSLEGFLGRYGNIFLIHLFDKIKNVGFLLDRVDIFVEEDLNLLAKSIFGIFKNKNIEFEEIISNGEYYLKNIEKLDLMKTEKDDIFFENEIKEDKQKIKPIKIMKNKDEINSIECEESVEDDEDMEEIEESYESDEEDSLDDDSFRKKVREIWRKYNYRDVKKLLENPNLNEETKHIYRKAALILNAKDYNPFTYYDKKNI